MEGARRRTAVVDRLLVGMSACMLHARALRFPRTTESFTTRARCYLTSGPHLVVFCRYVCSVTTDGLRPFIPDLHRPRPRAVLIVYAILMHLICTFIHKVFPAHL